MSLDRNHAWQLLTEFTQNPSLIKHALAVEAAMRAYARYFGEDEETWGAVGLIHDFDYERYPNAPDHPLQGSRILRERGYPEDIVMTVASHASYTNIPRDTLIKKTLFAVDELTGFITAVALVKPNKSLDEVDAASVKKKMKDKAFARNVNRDEIREGAELLGRDLDEHIAFVIDALKPAAAALGLQGQQPKEVAQ